MPKLKGPCFSLDAAGKLGGTLVYARTRSRLVAKKLTAPRNPRSGRQRSQRVMVRFLTQQWSLLTAADKATWELQTEDKHTSPYHLYLKENLERWRNELVPTTERGAPMNDGFDGAGGMLGFGEVGHLRTTQNFTFINKTWGFILHGTQLPTLVTSLDNVLDVQRTPDQTGLATFRIFDLTPGLWRWRVRFFTNHGRTTAFSGEQTDTVL